MDQKTHDKGLEIRKAVLGEAYVANALKNADDFNNPFQELVDRILLGRDLGPRTAAENPQHAQPCSHLDPEPAA